MDQWVCKVCRYSQVGESPPDVCPVCGAASDGFDAFDDGATEPELRLPMTVSIAVGEAVWRCQVCAYEHNGIQPPEVCPICGVGAELFDRISSVPRTDTDRAPTSDTISCTVCGTPAADSPSSPCSICGSRTAFVGSFAALTPSAPTSTRPTRRYVIVGSGVAATCAADEIRSSDPLASITMLSREVCLPYQRINLTRYLGGEVDAAGLLLHPPTWYVERRIDVRLETDVRSIDVREHVVRTRFGPVRYDRLILATGARVVVPPVPNARLGGIFAMRTFAEASGILAWAGHRSRAVVAGGGLLGLETAYALFRRGCEVTVCEGAERLMPRQLDATAAGLLRKHLEDKGLRFVLGDRPRAFLGEERVRGVELDSGTQLPADLVLLATGIAPNVELAVDAGLRVERGILIDDRLVTSDSDIFAAGDTAQHAACSVGLWTVAMQMGAIAGRNAAGASEALRVPTAHTTLKVVDLDVFSVGKIHAEGEASREFVHVNESGPIYRKLVVEEGKLVGGILIGDTRGIPQLIAAVRDQADVQSLMQGAGAVGDILRALAT